MSSERQSVRLPALYLGWLFLVAVLTGERDLHLNTAWSLGDWLINYEGGFVRRGLWGAIFLHVAKFAHMHGPLLLPILLGCLLYAVLYVAIFLLVRSIRWSWWMVCLFVSPVTLAFPLVSVEFYKKELVLFVGLVIFMGLLSVQRRDARVRDWQLSAYLTVFCVIAILGHEPVVVYLPYFCVAAMMAGMRWRRMGVIALAPAVGAGVALAAVLLHPGDAATTQAICAAFGVDSQRLCHGGAIAYLAYSKAEAHAEVVDAVRTCHYALVYPITTLLALVPFAGGVVSLWRRSRETAIVLLVTFAVSSLLSVALFYYATDWGRWIETGLFCVFLLLLFAENQPAPRTGEARGWRARPWALALVLVYATCWSMPGYYDFPLFGYVSMAGRWLRPHHLEGVLPEQGGAARHAPLPAGD